LWCVDRFAEKYFANSGYHYALNNPLRNIDINGNSVVVLSASEGASGLGHAAVLVGNDKSGWNLYSKNGTNENGGISGQNNKGDNNGTHFQSLKDFANNPTSPQNTEKTKTGKPEYQEAYLIATDSKIIKGQKQFLRKIII
jgi:hypothetical protein